MFIMQPQKSENIQRAVTRNYLKTYVYNHVSELRKMFMVFLLTSDDV